MIDSNPFPKLIFYLNFIIITIMSDEVALGNIRKLNEYLLKTWVPAGQNGSDPQIGELFGQAYPNGPFSPTGNPEQDQSINEVGFGVTSSGEGWSLTHDETKFASLSKLSQCFALESYLTHICTQCQAGSDSYNLQFDLIKTLNSKYNLGLNL